MSIYESTTGWYYGELVDEAGVLLASANIETLHVLLYDKETDTEISSFDAYIAGVNQNNGITIDDSNPVYNLTYVIPPGDNPIINSNLAKDGKETHVILFEGTTSGTPSHTFIEVAEISIKNVHLRPVT